MEPHPELLGLGEEVVADPAARRKCGRWRLGVEVTMEAEGEDGLGTTWRPQRLSPPTSRRGRPQGDVEGPAAPVGQQGFPGNDLPAAVEAALQAFFIAQGQEGALVLAALFPGGHDLWRLGGLLDGEV
jgi:hypothetical protein